MSSHTWRRFACLLLLTGILSLVLPASAGAVVYSFGQHPDKERLVLDFKGKVPPYSVARTGRRELTLSVPGGGLGAPGGTPDLGGSRFVSGVRARGGNVVVTLKSDAFGYVAFALEDRGKVVLDVFADPLGARWKAEAPAQAAPAEVAQAARPEPPAAPEAPRAEPAPAAQAAEAAPAQPEPVQAEAETPRTAPEAPQAAPETPEISIASPEPARAPVARVPVARQGRAVRLPNVFRGRVLRPGEEAPAQGFEVAQAPAASAADSAAPPALAAPDSEAPAPSVRRRLTPPGQAQPASPEAPASQGAAPAAPAAQAPEAPGQREVVKRLVKNLLEGKGSAFRGAVPGSDEALSDVRRRLDAAGKGPLEGESDIQPTDSPLPQPDAEQAAAPPAPGEQPAPAEAPAAEAVAPEGQDAAAEAAAPEGPSAAEQARQTALEDIFYSAQVAQSNGDHENALKELGTLLAQPDLKPEMREEAMYMKADILYSKYKDDLEGNFDEINGAYEAAVNFNLDSWRVPAALLRRGVTNLKVGNIPEAEAYFRILRSKFKGDPNVPLSYYYWGDHYFRQGDFQKAADEFQYLVQVFPDSKFVREASIGLARSLRKLGYDKQAFQIVDYIEKRWPRFYVEFPPFLRLLGDAAYAVEDFEKAKNDYWTYYNIDPNGDEADIILAKLGDIYVRTGRELAAREVYDKALADFPDREGGLIAKMRLAEEGIYDEPTVEQMFTVFDRPMNLKPAQIYEQIIKEHADSPLAPLAQLKLGMWHLWNNKFVDAMGAVEDFEKRFPSSNLADRARSVGVKAFGRIVGTLISDENYPKIVDLWEEHAFLRDKAAELEPSAKLALALAFFKRGRPGTALDVIMPFLREEQVPEFSEMAMSLALSIFVENQAWERVLEVAEAVKPWEIASRYKRELDYAQALALENLGRFEDSRPLWNTLVQDRDLDDRQRAYAVFFLARDALAKEDYRTAYDYAQDAYETLVAEDTDQAKIRECLAILTDVTERSARFREAIKWADLYKKRLPEGDPGRQALDYRIAGLYRRGGDTGKWRELLTELSKEGAGTLYGRMAASDLEMEAIQRESQQYIPDAKF
ncbi:tetratricopeptide repeat protein [Desulfocurvus sp. DL9XJH121]